MVALARRSRVDNGTYTRWISLEAYLALVGKEVGTSEWFAVDQPLIDGFADITRDHQFIHVDPERARQTPFGGTIAHGFLTLSLLAGFAYEVLPGIEGSSAGVNYGMNNLRFLAPVRSGKRVRARFVLKDCVPRQSGAYLSTVSVTLEIEGESKPALVVEWLTMAYL
jgi:acyl dehydratase